MKCLLSLFFAGSLLQGHEGHDHSVGVGAVVSSQVETGPISNRFITEPGWGRGTQKETLGSIHGDITLDQAGNAYVSILGNPGMAKFDKEGKFHSYLKGGLTNCHSLTTVVEDGKEFIWAGRLNPQQAVKFDLEGNGGMKGLTELLVGPDGDLYFFMGYGSKKIHRIKPDGTLVKSYGGGGKGKDQFTSCHGAAFDFRYDEPRILVCDRDGRRMIHLTPDLEWIGLYGHNGVRRPADVDVRGDYAAVALIEGGVQLYDRDGIAVALLLDNPDKKQWATNQVLPKDLHDSRLSAPHGIKWGADGSIYVAEWSKFGRVVKLVPRF